MHRIISCFSADSIEKHGYFSAKQQEAFSGFLFFVSLLIKIYQDRNIFFIMQILLSISAKRQKPEQKCKRFRIAVFCPGYCRFLRRYYPIISELDFFKSQNQRDALRHPAKHRIRFHRYESLRHLLHRKQRSCHRRSCRCRALS